jgi:hypothetical protein
MMEKFVTSSVLASTNLNTNQQRYGITSCSD